MKKRDGYNDNEWKNASFLLINYLATCWRKTLSNYTYSYKSKIDPFYRLIWIKPLVLLVFNSKYSLMRRLCLRKLQPFKNDTVYRRRLSPLPTTTSLICWQIHYINLPKSIFTLRLMQLCIPKIWTHVEASRFAHFVNQLFWKADLVRRGR